MPRAILLSGGVGSGKSTLLLRIGDLLEELGQPYALVDLDWLAWLHPAPGSGLSVPEALVENLRAVWSTYRRAGVERLVLARFLERGEQLDSVREALAGVDLFVVRLDVSRPELEARLRRRDGGRELVEHLALAAAEPPELGHAVVASGDDRRPDEVALEILAAAGWLP